MLQSRRDLESQALIHRFIEVVGGEQIVYKYMAIDGRLVAS